VSRKPAGVTPTFWIRLPKTLQRPLADLAYLHRRSPPQEVAWILEQYLASPEISEALQQVDFTRQQCR
jgi:hypothetical protein